MEAIATSDSGKITDDSVALEMKHIFSQLEIYYLDIADDKQLLLENKYDLDSLVQSNAASIASKLGIEEYVAKIIISAAKMKATQ